MPHVYSTITNDTKYGHYSKGGADLPILEKTVLIKGGATRGGKGLITPLGVGTQVSDEDLAYLESLPSFQRHKKAGFITVVKSAAKNPDDVAKNMAPNDNSSPKMVKVTTGKDATTESAEKITEKVSKKAKG